MSTTTNAPRQLRLRSPREHRAARLRLARLLRGRFCPRAYAAYRWHTRALREAGIHVPPPPRFFPLLSERLCRHRRCSPLRRRARPLGAPPP